ncbi:MAG: uroporphyrinogen decarboxylase [Planctomycetes bacterium]|nr:uroporphyrinogen decarboxylase [Planctomycetota bacterium]
MGRTKVGANREDARDPSRGAAGHKLVEALYRRPHDGVPVWFMRQAGRYLPGYRRVRSQVDFLTLCKTPELAAEVSLEPLATFGVDAVIIFSDILIPLEAMGMPVVFTERGPCMERPLESRADIERLRDADPERDTGFVLEVIREVRRRAAGRVPVIGFAGAPFTLACYALEGSPSRTFAAALALAYRAPAEMHLLLERIAAVVARYLKAQVAAGADVIQLFDSWGGLLAHDAFREFVLPYCSRILRELDGSGVPRILFIKGGGLHLDEIAGCGAEGIGIDYTIDPSRARETVAARAALQGNLAPEALFGAEADLRARARALLEVFRGDPGYVFNLGHGILPGTPVEREHALVDEVRRFAPA